MAIEKPFFQTDETTSTGLVERARMRSFKNVKPAKIITRVQSTPLVSEGDITLITGLKKAGKSAVVKRLIKSYFNRGEDNFGIYSDTPNGYVFYVDTEMHPADTRDIESEIKQNRNIKFEAFNIRGYEEIERVNFIHELCSEYENQISVLIIDGVADLVDSILDESAARALVKVFFKNPDPKLSFVLLTHEKRDGGGSMGWLGQYLEKKAFGKIKVAKNREKMYHTITCDFVRKGREFEEIIFAYNDTLKDFETLTDERRDEIKSEAKAMATAENEARKNRKLVAEFKELFGKRTEMQKASLKQKIMDLKVVSEKTAYRQINKAIEDGYLTVSIENNETLKLTIQ